MDSKELVNQIRAKQQEINELILDAFEMDLNVQISQGDQPKKIAKKENTLRVLDAIHNPVPKLEIQISTKPQSL